MFNKIRFAPLFIALLLMSCGPDTIFVRPGLDTPSQHVVNGNQLLKSGKFDDACREFIRAKELDPNFVRAYVGLGLALGHKGDLGEGMKTMAVAEKMADSAQDYEVVKEGYAQLNALKNLKNSQQSTTTE